VRLIIREYLSMLKESGELDSLLGDLLLSMDIEPVSKAQIGVRQYGVDLAGVGPDPEDSGSRKVFLFTVKAGDINRNNWDTKKQDVRPSLNEILDVYIPKHLDSKYKQLPKKIVVCCNGDRKQEVEENWSGFTEQNSIASKLEFDFWGADRLSLYSERYFLDEYLFPESTRKKMRRSLALVGLPEYDLSHFYALVEETLFERKLPKSKDRSAQKKRLKAIRLVHLALRIIFTWAQEEGNLKPPLLAAEYTMLRVWDWMRQWNLLSNRKTLVEFSAVYESYQRIGAAYFNKIQRHCGIRDGLFGSGYAAEEVEYPIRTFEVIGILGTLGASQFFEYAAIGDKEKLNNLAAIGETLALVIRNNPVAATPCFDGHSIDICLGLIALSFAGRRKEAAKWIEELIDKTCFAYRIGRHFPVSTDSYDDLVALEVDQGQSKEELTSCSTIFPLLARWCAILDLGDTYKVLRASMEKVFSHCSMQVWYPDEKTDEVLYRKNASATGTTLALSFPEQLAELREQSRKAREHVIDPMQISCLGKNGFPLISLIASRHFRTPVMPYFWKSFMDQESKSENDSK